jgi:hypothetical protein
MVSALETVPPELRSAACWWYSEQALLFSYSLRFAAVGYCQRCRVKGALVPR